jgi:hypothetical protein
VIVQTAEVAVPRQTTLDGTRGGYRLVTAIGGEVGHGRVQ